MKASKGFLAKNDHVAMQQKEIDTLEDDKFNAQVSEMILPVVETSQIKVLTKALLDKQAMLEAVTAEKNTLAFKVEKCFWHGEIKIFCNEATLYPTLV